MKNQAQNYFKEEMTLFYMRISYMILCCLCANTILGQPSQNEIRIPPHLRANAQSPVVVIDDARVDSFDQINQLPDHIDAAYTQMADQAILIHPNPNMDQRFRAINDVYKAIPVKLLIKNTENQLLPLYLVYFVEKAMTYNKESGLFEGLLGFYLQKEKEDNQGSNLKAPVSVEITATDVVEILPKSIKIDRINELNSIKITDNNPVDSVILKFVADFIKDEKYANTSIPVKPSLSFSAYPRSIQGWGLGKELITLSLEGKSGDNTKKVTFSPTNGTVRPSQIELNASSSQQVSFYSKGLKGGKLEAIVPNMEKAVIEFDYYFPWPFLLVSIAGGIVGSFIHTWRKKRSESGWFKNSWMKNGLISIVWGLICAVGFIFGINFVGPVIPMNLPINEASIFLIAAIGGGFLSYLSQRREPSPEVNG